MKESNMTLGFLASVVGEMVVSLTESRVLKRSDL